MSLISKFVQTVLGKLGLIAILAGSAVILGETFAGMAFTPATGRVVELFQQCELVDTSGRGIKYVGDGECTDMKELKTSLFPRELEIRPYRAAHVVFNDKSGQEITSTAHVAGLGVPNPKPLDTVAILYNPSNPAAVRGPTNRTQQGFAFCVVLAGLLMFFSGRAMADSAD